MKWILSIMLLLSFGAIAETPKGEFDNQPEKWTFKTKQYRQTWSTGLVKKELPASKYLKRRAGAVEIPDKLDLRPLLTEIRDQDGLGSCWAFSLIANLNDYYKLAGMFVGLFSEEYLTQCSDYCNGGYFDAADEFVKPKAAPLNSEVPYTASCWNSCKKGTPAGSIESWYMVGSSKPSPQEIQEGMLLEGKAIGAIAVPASVTVNASFGGYSEGLYNNCGSGGTNHMTNIVGWDNKGCKPEADGYYPPSCKAEWIMRNSWGKNWGMDGYMRIQMTYSSSKSKCNRIGEEAALYKLAYVPPSPTCGNGKIEAGEQCDPPGAIPGDSKNICSVACQIVPAPTPGPSIWTWLMEHPIIFGILCVVVVGAVVMLILLLCGVFKKKE